MISTKYGDKPRGDSDPNMVANNVLLSQGYPRILSTISKEGSNGLTRPQQLCLAEIARLACSHPDARVQALLSKALWLVKKSHLEYCLSLRMVK